MYQYTICNQPDESLYRRQCKAIEEKVPGIVEAKELANIDGGAVMIYKKDGATIKVKKRCLRRRCIRRFGNRANTIF